MQGGSRTGEHRSAQSLRLLLPAAGRARPGSFCRLRAAASRTGTAPGFSPFLYLLPLSGARMEKPHVNHRSAPGARAMAPGQVPALSGVNTLRSPWGCPGSAGAAAFLPFASTQSPGTATPSHGAPRQLPVLSWAGGQPCFPHPGVLSPAPGIPPEPVCSPRGEGQQLDVGSGAGRAVCWTPGDEKEAP